MTINPNDPWYPVVVPRGFYVAHPGVPIGLKLAAEALGCEVLRDFGVARDLGPVDAAWEMADAMIERANRDEETDDAK